MEESLKSISSHVSLKNIDFHGFSRSKIWVGYFRVKDLHDDSLMKKSTEKFNLFFKDHLDGFFLISALAFNDDSDGDPIASKKYDSIYQYAKQTGFLQPFTGDHDIYFEDGPLNANLLSFHFNQEDFMPFCEMVMALYFGKVVGGVCFLINPKLQIALYPHDDVGFGCISLNDDTKILIDFLNFCDKDDNFYSIIEEPA